MSSPSEWEGRRGLLDLRPPSPPQVPGQLHGSLVSHLPTQRHPLPRAELWENESRRPVFGLLPFCWGSPVRRGDPCVFLEDTPICPSPAATGTNNIPGPGAAAY